MGGRRIVQDHLEDFHTEEVGHPVGRRHADRALARDGHVVGCQCELAMLGVELAIFISPGPGERIRVRMGGHDLRICRLGAIHWHGCPNHGASAVLVKAKSIGRRKRGSNGQRATGKRLPV